MQGHVDDDLLDNLPGFRFIESEPARELAQPLHQALRDNFAIGIRLVIHLVTEKASMIARSAPTRSCRQQQKARPFGRASGVPLHGDIKTRKLWEQPVPIWGT